MKRVRPPHYGRWRSMLQRCYNPRSLSYPRYGGRGIRVCKAWQDFGCFQKWCLKTFEAGKTIDRRNNRLGYSPDNCRWATPAEQRANTRCTAAARERSRKFARAGTRWLHQTFGHPDTRKVKHCPRCRSVKCLSHFKSNRAARDGHDSFCLFCRREYDREYAARRRRLARHP